MGFRGRRMDRFFLALLSVTSVFAHSIPHEETNNLHPPIISRSMRREARAEVEKPEVWESEAKTTIHNRLNLPRIETRAKNLILMIGDGMGVSTLTASRILKGQREGLPFGEEAQFHMETFPYVGTSKTYCSDVQVADSACSSTAYTGGVKANYGTLGVTPAVRRQNCTESLKEENHVTSVLHWAQLRGMSTGIVTTTIITDASPAGSYAHTADRNWEDDAAVQDAGQDPTICIDIAKQLILGTPGKNINVILGGGRQHLLPTTTSDPEHPNVAGRRRDGRNLMDEWGTSKPRGKSVITRQELLEVDVAQTDFLLGLFSPGDLVYFDDISEANNDPTLAEMTQVAIQILSKNPNGFYLFVEGGNIDNAHHNNMARRALTETLEFDKAIKMADRSTSDEDTLILVSADHSHLFTIAGTPPRGESIFGFTGEGDTGDGLPATTLSYVNGPGYQPRKGPMCQRPNLTDDDVEGLDYKQMATYYKDFSTHGGEDVLIFAKGPFAHLFIGVSDQTFIAHGMKYAGSAKANSASQFTSGKLVALIGGLFLPYGQYFGTK